MRLQKYMAHSGAASRRKSEEYIKEGRVKVNEQVVRELGYIVDEEKDRVYLDDKRLKIIKKHIYIALNKPIGVVSTSSDEKDRKNVVSLVGLEERIYPVGRLDIDTTGLILLTDDGDLTNKITHPRNKIEKKYIAIVEGTPNASELSILRRGIKFNGESYSGAKLKILKKFDTDSIIEVIIHEGKNRQVKNMFEYIKHPVKRLKRVSIGEIELGDLEVGNFRYLSEDEIKYLKKLK